MRGWKHVLVGTGFLLFALYKVETDDAYWTVGLLLAVSGFFYIRALAGWTGTPGADLSLAVDFIRDPFETVIDEAAARLDDNQDEVPQSKERGGVLQQFARELGVGRDDEAAEKPAFDPDEAIARYLANRPAGDASPETAPPRAAGFGRKGL